MKTMKKKNVITYITTAVLAAAMFTTSVQAEEVPVPERDEIVYVLSDASGAADKVIVSDRFDGITPEEAQQYMAELDEVENVKGDDYWQGVSHKDLPVEMTVTYYLEGNEITPEELAGKSGHLDIRFAFDNKEKHEVTDGDDTVEMYVPFMALTGALLDDEIYDHVEVTNGRAIHYGDHTVVIGYTFPGVQENLEMTREAVDAMHEDNEEEKESNNGVAEILSQTMDKQVQELKDEIAGIEVPSYFEISADVTDFELGSTYTILSNGVFNRFDERMEAEENSGAIDLNTLQMEMNGLTYMLSQLVTGSGELYDGLLELQTGVDTLAGGITELSTGLGTLQESSEELNAGAEQVFEILLEEAQTQIRTAGLQITDLTIENYQTELDGLLENLDGAPLLAQETAREQVTDAVKEQVWGQILTSQGLDAENYESAVTAGMLSDEQKSGLEAALDEQMNSDEIKAVIEENLASEEVQGQIAEAMASAEEGAASITSLKEQLLAYQTFYDGLAEYTNGVDTAAAGAATIDESMPVLQDGVTQLSDGALAISNGMQLLDEEGIQKLTGFMNTDLTILKDRLLKMGELSSSYTSFTDPQEGLVGCVRFLYKTAEIK